MIEQNAPAISTDLRNALIATAMKFTIIKCERTQRTFNGEKKRMWLVTIKVDLTPHLAQRLLNVLDILSPEYDKGVLDFTGVGTLLFSCGNKYRDGILGYAMDKFPIGPFYLRREEESGLINVIRVW